MEVTSALIWLGLFAAALLSDLLAAKWTDAPTRLYRANISAVHEALNITAGFTIFALYQDPWMLVPCVAGAWCGSFVAGVRA